MLKCNRSRFVTLHIRLADYIIHNRRESRRRIVIRSLKQCRIYLISGFHVVVSLRILLCQTVGRDHLQRSVSEIISSWSRILYMEPLAKKDSVCHCISFLVPFVLCNSGPDWSSCPLQVLNDSCSHLIQGTVIGDIWL